MDNSLSSFLTNVWENRYYILYTAPLKPGDTISERVYAMYAPKHGITRGITSEEYGHQLNSIVLPINWVWDNQSEFKVAKNSGARTQSIGCRIYLNVKQEHAVTVFNKIMEVTKVTNYHLGKTSQQPPLPPPIGQVRTTLNIPDNVYYKGDLARAKRGNFEGIVCGVKIAKPQEAYSGRADVIVVYLEGQQQARIFAEFLATLGNYYNNDVPPMTRMINWGISIGAEPNKNQRSEGNSFGMLRANLIGRALIKTVTGREVIGGVDTNLRRAIYPSVSLPNRLNFINEVLAIFLENNISINEPWK